MKNNLLILCIASILQHGIAGCMSQAEDRVESERWPLCGVCPYIAEDGGKFGINTAFGHESDFGQIYPLAVAAHAYDAENYFGPEFSTNIPVAEVRGFSFLETQLQTEIRDATFTFSVQSLANATHGKQQVSLKPQWAFFKNVPLGTVSYDTGSRVTCWAKVFGDKDETVKRFPPTYVNIHGDPAPYTYRLSSDVLPLGFDGSDQKSRAILYHIRFESGKGYGAALDGTSKTGLIMLYSTKDLEIWQENAMLTGTPLIELLHKVPMIGEYPELQISLGIKKSPDKLTLIGQ